MYAVYISSYRIYKSGRSFDPKWPPLYEKKEANTISAQFFTQHKVGIQIGPNSTYANMLRFLTPSTPLYAHVPPPPPSKLRIPVAYHSSSPQLHNLQNCQVTKILADE